MKNLIHKAFIAGATALICLTFLTNFGYGQSASTKPLDSCGGVNFTFVLTEIPGQNGKKQQVEVIAENLNGFRVHVGFKLRAVSNEGGNYTSTAVANGFNAGSRGTVSTFIPFGEENLTRTTYPKISQMGLIEVDIRNVEKLGSTPGAYSRGAKVGGPCGGKLKEIIPPAPTAEQQTAFIIAIKRNDVGAIRNLLERGVDINATLSSPTETYVDGTALIQALELGSDTEVVRFLVERGADVNATYKDSNGVTLTPIWAMYNSRNQVNNPDRFLLLLENGADPDFVGFEGKTLPQYLEQIAREGRGTVGGVMAEHYLGMLKKHKETR